MNDERRKAFEEWFSGAILPVNKSDEGYYTKEALEWTWQAALDYMESRLDSDEVVEAVSVAIEIEHQKPNRRYAKAALQALKGSIWHT